MLPMCRAQSPPYFLREEMRGFFCLIFGGFPGGVKGDSKGRAMGSLLEDKDPLTYLVSILLLSIG